MSTQVLFYDTTLRDGEQTPGVHFTPEQKLILAYQLQKLGIDIIEVGFPAAAESEAQSTRRISELLKRLSISSSRNCGTR